jgi:hypothetical protein
MMQKELVNKFHALPTLQEVGMALMQFAFKLQGTDHLEKDVLGMFRMAFVGFNFPKGEDKFTMFVQDVDIKSVKIQEFGFNLLPLKIEGGAEDGLAVCEITHHGQLGQAAKYIWIAYNCNLLKRQINSNPTNTNQPARLKSNNNAK